MTKPTLYTLERAEAAAIGVPEFVDSGGAYKYFGLRKALLWRLLQEKKIRGVSIRQRGKTRGKRLFDAESIRHFLRSNVDIDPDNLDNNREVE